MTIEEFRRKTRHLDPKATILVDIKYLFEDNQGDVPVGQSLTVLNDSVILTAVETN